MTHHYVFRVKINGIWQEMYSLVKPFESTREAFNFAKGIAQEIHDSGKTGKIYINGMDKMRSYELIVDTERILK